MIYYATFYSIYCNYLASSVFLSKETLYLNNTKKMNTYEFLSFNFEFKFFSFLISAY